MIPAKTHETFVNDYSRKVYIIQTFSKTKQKSYRTTRYLPTGVKRRRKCLSSYLNPAKTYETGRSWEGQGVESCVGVETG